MDKKVLDYLATQRVCSLALVMPDGTSHSAAMHYSHQNDPLSLFIQTENTSRKCQGLLAGRSASASVAIGFSEQDMSTLQMDGQISLLTDPSKLPEIYKTHYSKHPHAEKYKSDPKTVFLIFTPSWFRYTEFKVEPPHIIESHV